MKIRLYGDPILRKVTKKTGPASLDPDFIKEMVEMMYTKDGVGLAAPQIGVSERFFVYDVGEGLNIVVNPEILDKSKETSVGEEGCLSIPEVYEEIPRSDSIRVRYFGLDGKETKRELEGYEARVFQHEFDHLDGKLFIDYLSFVKKRLLKQKLDEIKKKSVEVLRELEQTATADS